MTEATSIRIVRIESITNKKRKFTTTTEPSTLSPLSDGTSQQQQNTTTSLNYETLHVNNISFYRKEEEQSKRQ
jgi:hypothetical protein